MLNNELNLRLAHSKVGLSLPEVICPIAPRSGQALCTHPSTAFSQLVSLPPRPPRLNLRRRAREVSLGGVIQVRRCHTSRFVGVQGGVWLRMEQGCRHQTAPTTIGA